MFEYYNTVISSNKSWYIAVHPSRNLFAFYNKDFMNIYDIDKREIILNISTSNAPFFDIGSVTLFGEFIAILGSDQTNYREIFIYQLNGKLYGKTSIKVYGNFSRIIYNNGYMYLLALIKVY